MATPVVKPFDSQIRNVSEILSHNSENEQIRIFPERRKWQILTDCQAEIQKHEFQADNDRRSTKVKMKWSSRNKKKFVVLIKGTNDVDKIINYYMVLETKLGSSWKAHEKDSEKCKNWSDFNAQQLTLLQDED